MIITKVILENINGLDTGMGVRKLTINFPVNENKICLLTAPNGTGKTTLLSLLTPFATLGNIDIRDGYNLIIPGENGYKEIHIKNKNDLFVIKHYYTWSNSKENWSIKSYIEKNGEELNPNGNVTSFKELVSIELDLELDYLKLTRLGSNVSSLLSSSETDRKTYMSKLLDDVDIYLKFYKKVNSDVNELKTMISHSNNKLLRLGITDFDDTVKHLKRVRKEISELEEEYDKFSKAASVCEKTLSELGSLSELNSRKKQVEAVLSKMERTIKRLGGDFATDKEYERRIETETKRLNELNINRAVLASTIDNLVSSRNKVSVLADDEKIKLSKFEDIDNEIAALKKTIEEYDIKIQEYEETLKGFRHRVTEQDFKTFVSFIYSQQNTVSRVYEYGDIVTKEAVKIYQNKDDIQLWVSRQLSKLQRNGTDETVQFISKRLDEHGLLHTPVSCSNSNCPNEKFVSGMREFVIEESKKDTSGQMQDFVYSVLTAYNVLIGVLSEFDDRSEFIKSLPKKMIENISEENLLKAYSETALLFSESLFMNYSTLLHEETVLEEIRVKREGVMQKINSLKQSTGNQVLMELYGSHLEEIDKYNEQIHEARLDLGAVVEAITECEKTIATAKDELEIVLNYDETLTELKDISDKLQMFLDTKREYDNYTDRAKRTKFSIESCRKMEMDLQANINQYKAIKKELNLYSKHYDNMILVKEALSSRKGMPLYYIKMYLNDTKEVTNKLLDIVYNGDIQLDDFDLSPSSFSIPFLNRGKRIKDVKYASQGEQAFLSIALSFALSARALTRYNIMLLDEIDATLDINNREKFLQIIDSYTDMIRAEQCILISHSGAFNYCSINLIDLSNDDEEELRKKYPLATVVDIVKE